MFQIVCFGDSNTWGYNPENGKRHDENTRWTGVLQKLLGDQYNVVECGINGRTTVFDEPYRECRNGRIGLGYSLQENKPIDLLIVSLGTNDLKYTNAAGSAKGLRTLLRVATHSEIMENSNCSVFKGATKILVVSPISLGAELDSKFPDSLVYGKYHESLRFAEVYKPICDQFQAEFLDAAQYAHASEKDCLHMDAVSHRNLAAAICEKVKQML